MRRHRTRSANLHRLFSQRSPPPSFPISPNVIVPVLFAITVKFSTRMNLPKANGNFSLVVGFGIAKSKTSKNCSE